MSLRSTAFSCLLCVSLISVGLALSPLAAAAKARTNTAVDSAYVSALNTADRLLHAWDTGDMETGIALLTTHAKERATSDGIDKFFSPGARGYEITRGKLLTRGRYEFPVALMTVDSDHHVARHFSTIVIVNTGNRDWAVDKLP
jgi:hypothetical protein